MVTTGIYCTDVDVKAKAKNISADIDSGDTAETDAWIVAAENLINCTARRVFAVDSTAFTALPVTTKKLLTEVSSNIAAIYAVTYDMSGFTSRVEAEDMINIFRDAALRGLSILRDKKTQDFLTEGGGN